MGAIDATEKRCKKCGIVKPTVEFYKQSKIDGLISWLYYDPCCKKCRSNYGKERRKKIKQQAIEYFGGKCVDCGYDENFPEVYDFHHLDPTQKDYAAFECTRTFETILPELQKCVLLCANCHRKRHRYY